MALPTQHHRRELKRREGGCVYRRRRKVSRTWARMTMNNLAHHAGVCIWRRMSLNIVARARKRRGNSGGHSGRGVNSTARRDMDIEG